MHNAMQPNAATPVRKIDSVLYPPPVALVATWFRARLLARPESASHAPAAPDMSSQALEESQAGLDDARARWSRVDDVAARADRAGAQLRAQLDQRDLAEIVRVALGGKGT